MKHNFIHKEDGLTLMELIVTIAILSIVTTMIFSFLMFGMKSFQFGTEQIEDQANLRLTAYKITDEVRNVRSVNLLASGAMASEEEHIYLANDFKVVHNDETPSDIIMSDDLIQDMTFVLAPFNGKGLLTITLTSLDGEVLATEVLLNNILMDAGAATKNGEIIEYDFNAQ